MGLETRGRGAAEWGGRAGKREGWLVRGGR